MAKRKGIAQVWIEARLCKGTEGCGLCLHVCPEGVLGAEAQISRRGSHPAAVLHPERCTGCERCMLFCPDLAVTVERREVAEHA